MKVLVCVKATKDSEAGVMPTTELLTAMGKFNEALVNAGIMLDGVGLTPSSRGARVRFSGDNRTVIDGPFAETKELIAGFWVWQVKSLQEAIDWVRKCPNPMNEDSDIEIRPYFEVEDFGKAFTPELQEQERELGAAIKNMSSDESEIRRIISNWNKALEAKDSAGLVADYAPEAILYDAIPPYKAVGREAIRQAWAHCLPYFPEQFKSEHRDITIHVDGNTAFMHCLHHFIPTPPEHPSGQTWMRVSVGYRRLEGKWKVVHEHVSVPFNPMNNQAWYIRDPNTLDMPDYGQVCK